MRAFSNLGFTKKPPKEILLFLLGLFSTLQILQVAGFALSTWLTVLTAGYFLITHGFDFRKDLHLLAMAIFTCITFIVSMLADIPSDYKKASFTGTLQWILIFIICSYVRKENTDGCTKAFFTGFDWSCKVQLVWCVLQIGFWYILKSDINAELFGELLHMSSETSQYRKGILACTGLHWHAANLIPIIAYTYFRYRTFFVKVLCIVIVYFTKNATALIAITGAVGLDFLLFLKRNLVGSLTKKTVLYIFAGCIGILLLSPVVFPKISETVNYLLQRFYQINHPSVGNESSAVHFNYYQNLPHILQNIPFDEALLGSGINTSGYRFSSFYGQYPDQIWVVESDFVDAVLSRGLIGMVLQYALLIRIACRAKNLKKTGITCLMVILLVCGFIYDNQFLWVQLTEFMLYCNVFYPHSLSPTKE